MTQSPRYMQIADDLRRRIESREFAADTPLPTEGGLQKEYQASRNTVREAVKLLVQQHLLETRAGQGTFVTREIVPFVTTLSTDPETGLGGGGEEGATYPRLVGEQNREAGAATPEVTVLRCGPQIAERLHITDDPRVVSRHQERYIDGTVWSRQTSYYPLKWVTKGATGLLEPEDIDEGAVDYLATTIGLRQVGYRDLVSARLPNDKERALFNLTHNHTVIEVYRTSFAEDETPIRVTVTVLPSDRNQLVYDIGHVPDQREEPVLP
jgi:GntR family transcriptional regulator